MYFKKYLKQDYFSLSDNDNIRLLIEHLTYSSSQEKNYNSYQRNDYIEQNNKFFSYLFTHVFTQQKHTYKLRKILNYISTRSSVVVFNNFHLEKLKFLQFLYHLIEQKSYFQADLLYQNKRYLMSSYYFIFEIVKKLHNNLDSGKIIFKYTEQDWYLNLLKYSAKIKLPLKDYIFKINGNDYFSDFPIYIYNLYNSSYLPEKNKYDKWPISKTIIEYLFTHSKSLQCPLYSENHNIMFELTLTKQPEVFNLGIKLLKQFTEEDYFYNLHDGQDILSNLDIILSYGKSKYISYLLYEKESLFHQDKLEKNCHIHPISSILYNNSLSLEEKKEFILKIPPNLTIIDKKQRHFLFYYVDYLIMYGQEFNSREKSFFNWIKNKFNIDLNEFSTIDNMNLLMFALKKSQYSNKFSEVRKNLLEYLILEQQVHINSTLDEGRFHPLHFLVKVPFQEVFINVNNSLAFDFFKNILDYFKLIGLDPNVSTKNGNNALHFALISQAHHNLINLLLDFGVNLNQMNRHQKSPYDYYKSYEKKKRSTLFPKEVSDFESTHSKIISYYEQNKLKQQFLIEENSCEKEKGSGTVRTKI